MSVENLQLLGYVICENTMLQKISISEDDLSYGAEEFDLFCDCLATSTSLQAVEIYAVENKQLLKVKFKHVNIQRETFNKAKIKFNYFLHDESV